MDSLEFRRSEIDVDPKTGDLVAHWIGARARDGAPEILACTLTIFEDRNGDGVAQAEEIVRQLTGDTRGRKVQFDDVRVSAKNRARPLTATLETRTEKEERSRRFPFVPDD